MILHFLNQKVARYTAISVYNNKKKKKTIKLSQYLVSTQFCFSVVVSMILCFELFLFSYMPVAVAVY